MYSPPRPGRGTKKRPDRTEQDEKDFEFWLQRLDYWERRLKRLPAPEKRDNQEKLQASIIESEIKKCNRKIAQY